MTWTQNHLNVAHVRHVEVKDNYQTYYAALPAPMTEDDALDDFIATYDLNEDEPLTPAERADMRSELRAVTTAEVRDAIPAARYARREEFEGWDESTGRLDLAEPTLVSEDNIEECRDEVSSCDIRVALSPGCVVQVRGGNAMLILPDGTEFCA